jgi:hypothetical protein
MRVLPAIALSIMLVFAAVAAAATPGLWENKPKTALVEVGSSGKRVTELDLTCSKRRSVNRQFAKGKGPRISGGSFSFQGRARVIKGGVPIGHMTLTMSGRFVTSKKLIGHAAANGCASIDFTAKPTPQVAIPFD